MMKGIQDYLASIGASAGLCATDIKDREYQDNTLNYLKYGEDFLSDEYINDLPVDIDYIIMNPPYSVIEPFVMKALSMVKVDIIIY